MLHHLEQRQGLTANQRRVVFACAIVDMLNFYDFFIVSYLLAFIVSTWKLSYGQSALILVASSLGSIPGALVWGAMADRLGRRTTLIAAILNYSLASGLMAFCPDSRSGWLYLALCQFIFGFGFAGVHAIVIPLVQEFMPTARRGWAGGAIITGLSFSGLLASAAGAVLTPLIGWRGLCGLGALPALAILLVYAWVPESPRWLFLHGRFSEARRSLAWALNVDPREIPILASAAQARALPRWRDVFRYRRSLTLSSSLQFSYLAGNQTMTAWAATLLVMVLAVSPAHASYLMIFVTGAGMVGRYLWSYLSDRIGRRRSGALACLGAALAIVLAAHFRTGFVGAVSLFWLLLVVQRFFSDGGLTVVQPYSAEVWPAHLRASGMGFAYAAGSLGRATGIVSVALIAGSTDFVKPHHVTATAIEPALLMLAGWCALCALIFVFGAFETNRQSLEQIDGALQSGRAT